MSGIFNFDMFIFIWLVKALDIGNTLCIWRAVYAFLARIVLWNPSGCFNWLSLIEDSFSLLWVKLKHNNYVVITIVISWRLLSESWLGLIFLVYLRIDWSFDLNLLITLLWIKLHWEYFSVQHVKLVKSFSLQTYRILLWFLLLFIIKAKIR